MYDEKPQPLPYLSHSPHKLSLPSLSATPRLPYFQAVSVHFCFLIIIGNFLLREEFFSFTAIYSPLLPPLSQFSLYSEGRSLSPVSSPCKLCTPQSPTLCWFSLFDKFFFQSISNCLSFSSFLYVPFPPSLWLYLFSIFLSNLCLNVFLLLSSVAESQVQSKCTVPVPSSWSDLLPGAHVPAGPSADSALPGSLPRAPSAAATVPGQ